MFLASVVVRTPEEFRLEYGDRYQSMVPPWDAGRPTADTGADPTRPASLAGAAEWGTPIQVTRSFPGLTN